MIRSLLNGRARLWPRAALFFLLTTLAAACTGGGPTGPLPERIPYGQTGAVQAGRCEGDESILTPTHRAGQEGTLVRVGLLLPFSGAGADAEAASMLNAAQLAVFETGADRIVLIPKNTGGTAEGAQVQACAVLREGADIILGPLLAEEVRAVAAQAAEYGKPVLAFSNDQSVTETGAYLLSVTPEEEVWRIVSYATRQGVIAFATLAPDDVYGQRVQLAAQEAANANGSFLVTWEMYPAGGDASAIDLPARRLARFDEREAATRAGQQFELPYDAVILPAGGVELLSVAPLLPYYDVDPRVVRFLGTGRWRDPAVAREPSLAGGWFPGPDEAAHAVFADAYEQAFGEEPTRLAPLAYDGIKAIASLTSALGAAGLTEQGFERPTGFRGADGLFRFRDNRLAEHALAIYEVSNGRFVVIEPAPDSFAPAAF
jgi:hypothetical protein